MHPYHYDCDEPGDDDYPLPLCRDGRTCYGDCDRCDNPHEAYLDCDDDCAECPPCGPAPRCLQP